MKTITIGRSSSCDIVIADDGISRVHAEISLSGNQYVFKDISKNGSTINGSYVNNTKVVIAPGTNVLLANRVPLPWAQIYALMPLNSVRPYDSETRLEPSGFSCQQAVVNNKSYAREEDELNAGWAILSFLFPLIGFILYFVWRDKYSNKASKSASWAWAGVAFNIFSMLIIA